MQPRQLLTVRKRRIGASAHAEEEEIPNRSRNQRVIICKVVVNSFSSTIRNFFLILHVIDLGWGCSVGYCRGKRSHVIRCVRVLEMVLESLSQLVSGSQLRLALE